MEVRELCATEYAFAALTSDGRARGTQRVELWWMDGLEFALKTDDKEGKVLRTSMN